MGDAAMELGDRELDKIGEYVKTHLAEWSRGNVLEFRSNRELDLLERMVRVEESLKNQMELTKQGFESMDKRFESMDKRFESMDKRFESMDKRFEDMQISMDKRFEFVDKRFEDMQISMDKRFESVDKRFEDMQNYMDKRFTGQQWVMGLGFTVLAALMSIFNFF